MRLPIALAFIAAILVLGCVSPPQPYSPPSGAVQPPGSQPAAPTPRDECIAVCKAALNAGLSLQDGPCLLDPSPDAPDYACDIVHSPSQPVDDLPQNQCQSYRNGQAKHFIELDTNCNLLREN
jgi:hypothetical protein